jgi:hypothetical protein
LASEVSAVQYSTHPNDFNRTHQSANSKRGTWVLMASQHFVSSPNMSGQKSAPRHAQPLRIAHGGGVLIRPSQLAGSFVLSDARHVVFWQILLQKEFSYPGMQHFATISALSG